MTGHHDPVPDRPTAPGPGTAVGPVAGAAADAVWSETDQLRVRPYALTDGRAHPSRQLRLESLLTARTADAPQEAALEPEPAQAVQMCRQHGSCSVAEIAARIAQPVQPTKVMLADLIDAGVLVLARPATALDADGNPTPQLLEKLLAHLQDLPTTSAAR